MSNLRTAAQQALERLRKYHYGNGFAEDAECIADLEAALAQQVKTCAWRDNLDAIYETECGNLHIVNDGTLEENGMKYCCYCGKEIKDESPT